MDKYEKVGQIFLGALSEVLATVSGFYLDINSQDTDKSFDEVSGVMYMHGKNSGMLYVTANRADVRVICSHIIGVPVKDVTPEDIDDTMCELVNMTAGNAKLRLSETDFMFSLSQPFVIKGKDVSIVTKKVTHIVSGSLTNGELSVRLKAVY